MAIQTQGHQVQVMPQYVAPNPGLIAFNPQQISNGVLSSLQIADALARRKAFLDQQAELEATRQARIDAELARSGILTGTAQGQIAGTNAQNQSLVNTLPATDAAKIATANQLAAITPAQTPGLLADLAFKEEIRPLFQSNQVVKAQQEQTLNPVRFDTELTTLRAQQDVAPVQAELTLAQAQQQLASITEDKKLTDAQKLAQIRNLNASARASEAQAAYTERDRPRAGGPDLMNQLRDVQAQIQSLEKSPVVNPNLDNEGMPVPLIQYQAQTRGPDGMPVLVDAPGLFTGDRPVTLNPAAEKTASQLQQLYQLRDQLTQAVSGGPSATAKAAPSTTPKAITSKAEFDALPSGSPFIFNGKAGVKK